MNNKIRRTLIITNSKKDDCLYIKTNISSYIEKNELLSLELSDLKFTNIIYQCKDINPTDTEKLIFINRTIKNCKIIICIPFISSIYKQLFNEIGIEIRQNSGGFCEYCKFNNELKELSIYFLDNVLNIETSKLSYLGRRAINLIIFDIPNLSQSEIAKKMGISSDYLSKILKKDTKINFRDFTNRLKLYLAKELLKNNEITLVSEKLGFSEVNNFHRFFRKNEGITPHAYYEQCRSKR